MAMSEWEKRRVMDMLDDMKDEEDEKGRLSSKSFWRWVGNISAVVGIAFNVYSFLTGSPLAWYTAYNFFKSFF